MLKNNAIHNLDVLKGLRKLPDESIDMVLTSPPYWSLRDYGKSTDVIWGGDPKCKHKFADKVTLKKTSGESKTALVPKNKGIRAFTYTSKFCNKCGAWKGQLGLEPTIDLFIEHLVQIFDEVYRVLKKTGTCWVNFGDTYYTKSGNCYSKDNISSKDHIKATGLHKTHQLRGNGELPPKSLSLIPFRFALAMTKRGWTIRNVIIWHKPNCLPASAKDRFTVDFEYLFFFSKQKKYYFEKQLEPLQKASIKRSKYPHNSHPDSPYKKQCDGADMKRFVNLQGRNKRCVWKIAPKPLREAHFAVFPETLCEVPIKAGCPKEVCKKCGMPRLVLNSNYNPDAFNIRVRDAKNNKIKHTDRKASKKETDGYKEGYVSKKISKNILGCNCNAGYKPGIVLDPFMGSGTTGLVAKKLGRNYIGFELNPKYIKIAKKRLKQSKTTEKTKNDKT